MFVLLQTRPLLFRDFTRMTLDSLVKNTKHSYSQLSERIGNLYYPSLAFLTMTGLDMASTALCCKKYGAEVERNPIARHTIDQLGIVAGLIAHQAISIPLVLGAGYLFSRIGARLWSRIDKDDSNDRSRKLATAFLYGMTLTGLPIAVNNFVQYFKY